jgi:hypothetical protein
MSMCPGRLAAIQSSLPPVGSVEVTSSPPTGEAETNGRADHAGEVAIRGVESGPGAGLSDPIPPAVASSRPPHDNADDRNSGRR